MSISKTVTVSGLAELDDALRFLPTRTAKAILRRVLMDAGQPIEAAWQAKAPRLTGHMAESGGEGTRLSKRQSMLARKAGKSSVEVYVGPGSDPAGIQEEFGNSHQPPHPFMRPAWEETKDQALEIVKTELAAEIAKVNDTASARLAKNAARDLKRYG